MSKLEAALATWIAFHSQLGVNIEATLMPPATDNEIKAVEDALGFDLPNEVRELYKIANGQYDPWTHKEELEARLATDEYWSPLFGSHALIPLDEALAIHQREAQNLEFEREFREKYNRANPQKTMDGLNVWEVREEDPVDSLGWNPQWFIFAGFNADNLALDMNPPRGGTLGQIVEFGADVARLSVLSSSLTDLFEEAAFQLDVDDLNRYERSDPSEQSVGMVFFDMDWRNEPYGEQQYLDSSPEFAIELQQWQEAQFLRVDKRVEKLSDWLKRQGVTDDDVFNIGLMASSGLTYDDEISEMPSHIFDAMNAWLISRGDDPMQKGTHDKNTDNNAVWYEFYAGLASEVIKSSTDYGKHISSTIGHGMMRQDAIKLINRYWLESGEWTRTDYNIAEALRQRFSSLKIIEQGEGDGYSIGQDGSVLEVCWSSFDSETYKSDDFCERIDIADYRD